MGDSTNSSNKNPLIWEWPLRVWHWLIAICAGTALTTGLVTEWNAMDLHTWAGMSVVALLAFRLLWGIVGGTYSRFKHYFTTPKKVFEHFTGNAPAEAHTAPGIALVVCLMVVLTVQAVAGLLTTDDVFIEGPLVQFASDEVVEFATDLHHNAWWFVIGLIGVHLSAHIVYGGIFRSPTPLSMFSGRKPVPVAPTEFSVLRAILCYAVALGVLLVLLYYSR